MEIKIIPRKLSEKEEEKQIRIKEMIGSNELLSKILVFLQMNQPCSINALKDQICTHYQTDMERTKIFRNIKRLQYSGLINESTPNEIVYLENRDALHDHIMAKHSHFLAGIPSQFRKNYGNMSYFWVSNGGGINYLPYCCKILGFECNLKDNLKEVKYQGIGKAIKEIKQ